jgi:hypothetical protein
MVTYIIIYTEEIDVARKYAAESPEPTDIIN